MRDRRDPGGREMDEQRRERDGGQVAFGSILESNVAQRTERPDVGRRQPAARVADNRAVGKTKHDTVAGLLDPRLPEELGSDELPRVDDARVDGRALVGRCCEHDVGRDLRRPADTASDRERLCVWFIDAPRKRGDVRGGDAQPACSCQSTGKSDARDRESWLDRFHSVDGDPQPAVADGSGGDPGHRGQVHAAMREGQREALV